MSRTFFSVPPEILRLDPVTSGNRAKLSPAQLNEVVSSIPEVYRLRSRGVTREDFRRMAQSPQPRDRVVGQTYRYLFEGQAASERLHCELVRGSELLVVSGQHRVMEAQRQRLACIPVSVSYQNERDLKQFQGRCEVEVRRRLPELPDLPQLDREQSERLFPSRSNERNRSREHGNRSR